MNFGQFKTNLRSLAGVDVTTDQAGAIFHGRYRTMVARSKWLVEEIAIGPTVVDVGRYSIGVGIVDLEQLLVGSLPYSRVGTRKLFELKAGLSWLTSVAGEGVFAPAFGSDGSTFVEVLPVPQEAGTDITGLAAVLPSDLTDDAQEPLVPSDIHGYLQDGMVADGLALVDERLTEADRFEQRFEAGIELLVRRKNSRIGSGPTRIAQYGRDF